MFGPLLSKVEATSFCKTSQKRRSCFREARREKKTEHVSSQTSTSTSIPSLLSTSFSMLRSLTSAGRSCSDDWNWGGRERGREGASGGVCVFECPSRNGGDWLKKGTEFFSFVFFFNFWCYSQPAKRRGHVFRSPCTDHCRAKQVMIVNFDTFLINLIYHNNLLCYECALKVTPTATLIGFYRDESFVLSIDSDFE